MKKRFWEIDALRGIAIILMIIFHFAFDLNYFGAYKLGLNWVFWDLFPRIIASIFILLAGISLTLSYKKGGTDKAVKHGIKIFFFGILITIMTALTIREGTIFFGILHFIGLSTILSLFFIKLKEKNLLLGLLVILAGICMNAIRFDFPWLLWLGLLPKNLYMFDYFPLFPWFGVSLIGLFVGNKLYPDARRGFKSKELSGKTYVKIFSFLGRNSLLIYLLHQPILILVLFLLGVHIF